MPGFIERGTLRVLILLCLATQVPQAAAQYSTSDYDSVFSWVQTAYADVLPATGVLSGTALGYYYRYYPSANAFLGMKDDGVYYYTAGLAGPLYVGPVSNFIAAINSCKPRTMESAASTILSGRLSVTFEDTTGVSATKGLKRRYVMKNLTSTPIYLEVSASTTWGKVTVFSPQPGFAYLEAGGEYPGILIVEAPAGQAAGAVAFDLTLKLVEKNATTGASTPNSASVTRPSTLTYQAASPFATPSGTATMQFDRVSQVTTKTGFWTYGVDQAETMIVLFPGQEHWDSASLVSLSTIYAYKLDGTLLWKKATGAETWGGDLSRDGKYVVYATAYDTNATISPSLVLLDAATGQEIWKKSVDFTTFSRPTPVKIPLTSAAADTTEAREVRFSPSGQYIGFGTMRGIVWLVDRDTAAVRWSYETLGQVRGISFDAAETSMYVGTGDGYLYRFNLATGVLQWKTAIVSWPYTAPAHAPQRQWVVATTKSGDMTVIDNNTGACLVSFDLGILNVRKAVFTPDNAIMIAASATTRGSVAYETLLWSPLWSTYNSADTSLATSLGYVLVADNPTGYLLNAQTGAQVATLDTGFAAGANYFKVVFVNSDATRAVIARRDTSADAVNLVFFMRKGL